MLRMNTETSSPALPRTPPPALAPPMPEAAPSADAAGAPSPSAVPHMPAPATGRGAAPPTEAALLQEIEDSVRRGRVGHARSLADRFYRAYPESPEIERIERLTGYHPRPYGPRR